MILLQLRGVTRRFGGLLAVHGVDLQMSDKEICALIGPNGAGKTTLVNLVAGSLSPDAGSILFDGAEISRLPVHSRVQRGLTRSFQIVSVFARLSVADNALLALQGREAARVAWRTGTVQRDAALDLLDRVGLAAEHAAIAATLSHGAKRRLELALALASRPRLLLLDEPMAGIGPDEAEGIATLIQDVARNAALILVEHDMDMVFRLAQRVIVLHAGRVLADGPAHEVKRDTEVRRAYLGEHT
jgi:branched-chain amino acid transport system ATP-binding protein